MTRRLVLAARYVVRTQPLLVLGVALWAPVVAVNVWAGDRPSLLAAGVVWGLLVFVGGRLTVPLRVAQAAVANARGGVAPPS